MRTHYGIQSFDTTLLCTVSYASNFSCNWFLHKICQIKVSDLCTLQYTTTREYLYFRTPFVSMDTNTVPLAISKRRQIGAKRGGYGSLPLYIPPSKTVRRAGAGKPHASPNPIVRAAKYGWLQHG